MSELDAGNRYGQVRNPRLVKVRRSRDPHELVDLTIASFPARKAHSRPSTSTRTTALSRHRQMKNTVYALARRHPIDHIETFASALRIIFSQAVVSTRPIRMSSSRGDALSSVGQPHRTRSSRRGGALDRRGHARCGRHGILRPQNLVVLKTSSVAGFSARRVHRPADTRTESWPRDHPAWTYGSENGSDLVPRGRRVRRALVERCGARQPSRATHATDGRGALAALRRVSRPLH